MRRLRDVMTWGSLVRYAAWRVSRSRAPVRVQVRSGEQFWLRPMPSSDLGIARELFLDEAYAWPAEVPALRPRLILDAGANVGLSVVHWARRFPEARLVAYEPHPAHVALLERQVALNRLGDRVRVVPAAVSNRVGEAHLKPNESQSFVTTRQDEETIPVRVVDLFDDVGAEPADMLKMDIEGGEYAILADERLARLNLRLIVLEWHVTEAIPDGRRWCRDRLISLGYQVTDGNLRHERAGILWAWK